ncbi:MAG: acyl-CoA dehydrogenase family protein [Polyangiaceae bacterium]
MSFVLTEEQLSIQKTARDFARERLNIAAFRRLRDARDAQGFEGPVWSELGELGLSAVHLPEAWGGAGLGYAELGLVLQELGRNLAATPLFGSAVLAAEVLREASESQPSLAPLGERLAAGEQLFALAHEERPRFAPYAVTTRLERTPGGLKLTGEKALVLEGHLADQLLVVARSSGEPGARDGLSLVMVDPSAPGITRTRLSTVDSRGYARIAFSDVALSEDALLGKLGEGAALLDPALDRATIALSAEMLGGALEVFERTVQYLKERQQFGVPIGSFQALQHRVAQLFCELELSKSVVMEALSAVDEGRDDVPLLASVAKARLSDTYLLAASEGVQMHGGVGVTDEYDIGLFYKRARVCELLFGDAAYHRARFASLSGF